VLQCGEEQTTAAVTQLVHHTGHTQKRFSMDNWKTGDTITSVILLYVSSVTLEIYYKNKLTYFMNEELV
jgi:hypothetical protein